jgi:hypothetical protein
MIKKTITTFLVASTFLALSVSNSAAVDSSDFSVAVGVSGGFGAFTGRGEETEGSGQTDPADVNKSEGTEVMAAVLPSAFAEVTIKDRLTIGFDVTLGEMETEVQERTDDAYGDNGAANTGTSTVKAEFENLHQAYAELRIFGGFFVKGTMMQIDINTMESLHTDSSYGNITLDGTSYGIGHKANFDGWYLKNEVTYQDWDKINIAAASAATTPNGNSVQGEVNGVMAKLSIAKTF